MIADFDDVDLDLIGTFEAGGMTIEVVDPVTDYAELMETLFDFDAIRSLVAGGFKVAFDAMHAVTGPYATEILVRRLGVQTRHWSSMPRRSRILAVTTPIPTWFTQRRFMIS
jgi:phosphoglucomutase